MAESIEFHRDDNEWTAVYLNGNLQIVGDHYLADEWLQNHVGVRIVDDSAFMRGGNYYEDVAKTLHDVELFRIKRDERLERAAELRKRGEDLIRQSQQLEAM